MQVHCQDCDHSFLLTPNGMTQSAACEHCGGNRLERDQPSPTHSDGVLRDTVNQGSDPALGLDQGGNPNQEGIWAQTDGGWQPFRKRDESFASVKEAAADDTYGLRYEDELAAIKADMAKGMSFEEAHDKHNWHGIYKRDRAEGLSHEDAMALHENPETNALFDKAFEQQLRVREERKQREQNGQETPPSSAGSELNPNDHNLNWTPGQRGRALFVGPHLHSWNAGNPADLNDHGIMHGDYAKDLHFNHGVDPQSIDFTTGVEIDPDGTLVGGKHDPSAYAKIDPRLKAGGSQQWSFGSMSRAARSLNMDPYMPWTHLADAALEQQVAPQHVATVVPGPHGIHNGTLKWLSFLDAHVNGKSARENHNELFQRHGMRDSPEFGQPVEVAVHDQAHLPAAIETIETSADAKSPPQLKDLALQIHQGAIAPPPGINPAELRFSKTAGPLAALAIGGRALLGGLMSRGIAGTAMRQVGINSLMPGGGQQQQQPAEPLPVRTDAQLSHITADIETPHTNPRLVETEDGDTKQFDDESTDPAFQNPNVDAEAGGAAQGEDNVDGGIGANQPSFSPGSMETANLLLPKILDYVHSDKSALEDPQLKALHEQLEKEYPGYADEGDDEAVEAFLNKLKEPSAVSASTKFTFDFPGAPIQSAPPAPAAVPGQDFANNQGRCNYCGGQTGPTGRCAQCGATNDVDQQNGQPQGLGPGFNPQTVPGAVPPPQYPVHGKTAADHQGPTTDEQKAAVSQLLIDEGRHEEIPHMFTAPWDFAKEMAQIAQRPNVVPNVDPNEQPPPPPAQEIAPPGATMPVPNPADPSQMVSHRVAAPDDPNVVGVPAADQVGQQDVSQDQDSSHTWQTEDGQQLQVGQTYKVQSPKYAIPDIVKIVTVKPDSIVVEQTGMYTTDPNGGTGLEYQHEITRDEVQLDGLTFAPSDGQEQEHTPEEQQEDPNGPLEPANTEQQEVPHIQQPLSSVQDDDHCPKCANTRFSSEMSSPTTTFHECDKCAHVWETKEQDYIDHNTANREWINEDSGPNDDFDFDKVKSTSVSRDIGEIAERIPGGRTAGKNFTPREQREFIEEQGVARNADKLDLEDTHYARHRDLGYKVDGMNVPDSHLFMGW
jgi:DNA-directed RNA polymerase subunit M/transcription elongation factor TFIIS